MFYRLIAGVLGISVVLCSATGPAFAQQPSAQPNSSATAAPANAPRPAASAAAPSASAPNAVPSSAAQQAQGEELPPPPMPAVLPNVPNVAPGYGAPPNPPLPNGDLVGVNQP